MKEHCQMLNMTGFYFPMTKTLCLALFSINVNVSHFYFQPVKPVLTCLKN
jgi:hypothetical protein